MKQSVSFIHNLIAKSLLFVSLSVNVLLIALFELRNLDKVLAGGSQFGANQQLFDLYQR